VALYETFFQLKDSPFRLTPDPDFVYMTLQHREALSGLVHSVCSHSGLTVLVGEAGTGKTTLLHVLLQWLERLNFNTVLCTNPILSREELYDMLVTELGVDCASSLKNRQLMALDEKLRQARAEGRRTVLIVDEAQRLPADLLEEIRLLLNLETPREKLLEIILAGQQELMTLLRQSELRQLKQRVSSFCRLEALKPDELREYIHHRLAHAGLPRQTIFPEATFPLIYKYSQGLPRVINTLCESALLLAFALESRVVTPEILAEAASDMDLTGDRKSVALPTSLSENPAPPPVPAGATAAPVAAGHMSSQQRSAANGKAPQVPLENYSTRQKSLGFLANLIERWK
jgi:general secretion pathway protein A